MSLNKLDAAIKIALNRGYYVTEDGKLMSPYKKMPLKVNISGTQRYPTFTLNNFPLSKSRKIGIPIHRFAARCFYGVFPKNTVVRHLDGNVLNICKSNIILGTHSENNLDKPTLIRVGAAKQARKAQGYRAHNHMFSDNEVRYIRRQFRIGKTQKELARRFNVTKNCIHNIVRNKVYIDVTD